MRKRNFRRLRDEGANRPFPSCFKPHYEREAKCKVFIMKKSFHSYANKTNFHVKSFALSLAFITRLTATRKWPISHKGTIESLSIGHQLFGHKRRVGGGGRGSLNNFLPPKMGIMREGSYGLLVSGVVY